MDSGNSGSLQSSSGGDDEFDSRCAADSSPLSALLCQPPPPSSVPGFGGAGSLIYGLQELRTPPLSHWCSTTAPLPGGAEASASPPSLPGGHGGAMAADQADAAPAQAPAAAAPQRGSRKRERASRRAPTTVLTTDTSNFRAMVQEFTGIPAPPFAGGASATARSRFDHHHLFPLRTATAAAGTASPATLPHYLLRPFAQKVQVHASSATPYPPSFISPSASSPAPGNISIAPASTTTPGTTTAVASSDSYHQLTAGSTSALHRMQQDHGSNNNYHSFHQSSSLGGDGKYAAHPAFDRGIPPPPSSAARLQDPADFLGLTVHDVMVSSQGPPHAHLHPRNGGDELSGLVGGASVTGAGGCKATYSSTRPLLERSRRNPSAGGGSTATTTTAPPVAATAGLRTQAGVVDSWVCTSD